MPPTTTMTSAGRYDDDTDTGRRVGRLTFVAGETSVVDPPRGDDVDDVDDDVDGGGGVVRAVPRRRRRIVGVMKDVTIDSDDYYDATYLDDGTSVYAHTVAYLPDRISYDDALSTASACLVGVHCALPRVMEVGGGRNDDDVFYSGKVNHFFVMSNWFFVYSLDGA